MKKNELSLFEQYYTTTTENTRQALQAIAITTTIRPSEFKEWDVDRANSFNDNYDITKVITGKIDLEKVRNDNEYKRTLTRDGVVNVRGIPCKSETAIAKALGISKQDYNRQCHMCSMPIAYDDNYEHWIMDQFTAVYDIYKERDSLPNKFEWDMITPEMTVNDIKALHTKLKAIAVKDGAQDGEQGTQDGEQGAQDGTQGTQDGAQDKKPVDVQHIVYNDKLGRYEFKGATATEIQAFIHEHITATENSDKLLIAGNMVIKIPKS